MEPSKIIFAVVFYVCSKVQIPPVIILYQAGKKKFSETLLFFVAELILDELYPPEPEDQGIDSS